MDMWIWMGRFEDGENIHEFYKSGSFWSSCLMVESRIDAMSSNMLMLKLSHYRPGQSLSVPGVEASRIRRQSAHESGKVSSPTHRPPLPPGEISLISISAGGWFGLSVIVLTEGLSQWKIYAISTSDVILHLSRILIKHRRYKMWTEIF